MKKLFSIALLLFVSLFVCAQQIINDPNVELREVETFTGIDISGGIDLYLSSGNEAVAVSASTPEYRSQIKTVIQNGILKIFTDNNSRIGISINSNRRLRAYVSYKIIQSLEASGGSDIKVDGIINTNDLTLRLSGGSDFNGKVDAGKLTVRVSGGSDVQIAGKAGSLTVDASGGSDFNGYDLVADVCDLEASGACDIEVTANRELSARASGASDIQYRGKPAIKEAKASGASSVKGS
jgi:hypothetical protein